MLRDRALVALTVCLVAALIVVLAIGCSSSKQTERHPIVH